MTHALNAAAVLYAAQQAGKSQAQQNYEGCLNQISILEDDLKRIHAHTAMCREAGRSPPTGLLTQQIDAENELAAKRIELRKAGETFRAEQATKAAETAKATEAKAKARHSHVATVAVSARQNAAAADAAIEAFETALANLHANLTDLQRNEAATSGFSANAASLAQNALGKRPLGRDLELRGSWASNGKTISAQLEGLLKHG